MEGGRARAFGPKDQVLAAETRNAELIARNVTTLPQRGLPQRKAS